MAKVRLTDRFIKAAKPAAPGKRDIYGDALVPGHTFRVTERGYKSLGLIARFPSHPLHPTYRALGEYPALTLEESRDKARAWLQLIARGIDPRAEDLRQRSEATRAQLATFGVVAEQFLTRATVGLAHASEARQIVEAEFVQRWMRRPITDIRPEEVAAAIRAIVERGAPYQAHNALGWIRRVFSWAIGVHEFGITASPVAALRPRDLIGPRLPRSRVLTPAELRAVWTATELMGWPYGPLIRLLILTGQRLREIADLTWPEIDERAQLVTIAAARMKGGRVHEVPLAPMAWALLETVPRFDGTFIFSTTGGMKPVNGFSKAKARLDRLSGVADWVLHDLRRTVRTHFSALPIEDVVRELVIAHARAGLHRVYDQHSYQDEKRRCLELWEARLRGILEPAAITDLDDRRTASGSRRAG